MISRTASAFFLVFVAFTIFAAATTTTVVTATPLPPTATPAPASATPHQFNAAIAFNPQVLSMASNPVVGLLAGLLGILIEPITPIVGITCSPISVLGIGGDSCNAQAFCCKNNSFNGLIALGCSPANISL